MNLGYFEVSFDCADQRCATTILADIVAKFDLPIVKWVVDGDEESIGQDRYVDFSAIVTATRGGQAAFIRGSQAKFGGAPFSRPLLAIIPFDGKLNVSLSLDTMEWPKDRPREVLVGIYELAVVWAKTAGCVSWCGGIEPLNDANWHLFDAEGLKEETLQKIGWE